MRAVLDTNVIVSGVLSPDGPPGRLVEAVGSGELVPVVDERVLLEYRRVLVRPRFQLPERTVASLLDHIAQAAEWVTVPLLLEVGKLPDSGDAPFAGCALAAGVPLITGNTRHFPPKALPGLVVLTPREFLERLHTGPSPHGVRRPHTAPSRPPAC